jgi:hypothetical protein
MTPEEAHQRLVDSLIEVRKRCDAGADDWQYSLLTTFRKYAQAVGIDPKLLHPLELMRLEVADAIRNTRRRKEGKTGTPMPAPRAISLSVAAAAVTVLKERGSGVSEAERTVARATGIEQKAITTFRDTLNRGIFAADVKQGYEAHLAEVRGWRTADLLKQIDGLDRFVK